LKIYVDARCLQDPHYAFRGVGFHSATLIRNARTCIRSAAIEIIAVLDANMGDLPKEYADMFDCSVHSRFPKLCNDAAIFVQLSPMTHDQSLMAPFLGRRQILSCAIIYDFIPLEYPDRYLPTPTAYRRFLNNMVWLKYFHVFFPISRYGAARLSDLLNIAANRLQVTGCAIRTDFKDPAANDSTAILGQRAMPLDSLFLVAAGEDWRKNVECAIVAHAQTVGRAGIDTILIVVGHYSEKSREKLKSLHRSAGGKKDQLKFVHGVSDRELAALYRIATATICPSYIEGFSIPVVEAFWCNCPALVSNCDAHRELVGESYGGLFGPDEPDKLADLMVALSRDKDFRSQLLAQQRSLGWDFTEEKVSQRFWLRVIDEYDRFKDLSSRRWPSSKPRLAVLSPYPPDQSGVADYTAHCIPCLAHHAIVDVFTDAKVTDHAPSVRRFEPITELPYVIDEYDRVIAVTGNSSFHTRIIDYHRMYGGCCIEHDNRLAELYYWWRGPEAFSDMASRYINRPVTVEECTKWILDPNLLPTLFFEEVLPPSDPFIVHSRGLQAEIERIYGRKVEYLPFCSYRDFCESELSKVSRQQARRRLGVAPDKLLIVCMGLLATTKGPLDCVWALESLLAWGMSAELHFVGSSRNFHLAELTELAERLNLKDHLHVMDQWVSDQTYTDYLIAADFAIQLRTHRFGGLSGGLMDCVSAGLPTVANDDLAVAMEAPDFVLRCPDHFSPIRIAEAIYTAAEKGLHHQRVTPERDAYLKEHNFDNYARRLLEILGLC
jgi:glycosyltransferase involved in cell wall biosynthesis